MHTMKREKLGFKTKSHYFRHRHNLYLCIFLIDLYTFDVWHGYTANDVCLKALFVSYVVLQQCSCCMSELPYVWYYRDFSDTPWMSRDSLLTGLNALILWKHSQSWGEGKIQLIHHKDWLLLTNSDTAYKILYNWFSLCSFKQKQKLQKFVIIFLPRFTHSLYLVRKLWNKTLRHTSFSTPHYIKFVGACVRLYNQRHMVTRSFVEIKSYRNLLNFSMEVLPLFILISALKLMIE